ncbi:MAG: hypothetical protein ACT4PU_04425 [Planctomycetota bacterium]
MSTLNPLCRLARTTLILLGIVGAARAGETQIVFDLSPFEPASAGGEIFGISSAGGHVVHARIDATFVSSDPGPWTLWAHFALPTGLAGVDSQALGWSGVGTFSTSIETDAFNGQLQPPPGQPFYAWFVEWAGGTPFSLPGGGVGIAPVNGLFTEWVLTLTICACPLGTWADLGHALEGTQGEPQLVGQGNLCPSAPGALLLSSAKPGGSAFLVTGLSSAWLPFRGGLLIPDPDFLILALPLDGTGAANLPFTFPNGVPAGLQLWFQAWIPDRAGPVGFAASNALLATVPNDC